MLMDRQNMYCIAQQVTADVESQNVIDHGAYSPGTVIPERFLKGPIQVALHVTAVGTNAADGTLTIHLQTSEYEAFSGTPINLISVVLSSAQKAALAAGDVINFSFLPAGTKRYTQLVFDEEGTTDVTFTGGLVLDKPIG